jgi:thiol-disulfide isomerase/thioredoxin
MLEQKERSEQLHRSINRHRIGVAAAIAVLAVLGGVYWIAHLRSNPDAAACREAIATAGRIAPLATGEVAAMAVARTAFRVPDLAFKNDAGEVRNLKDWRGRTVLLNLWATWCVPCRKEMPALDALQAKLGGDRFQVVAVNIDTRDPHKPRAFLQQVGVTHLAYFSDDSAQVFETLKEAGKAFGMPTTLIIGPNGCEIGTMAGPAEWASDDGIKLVSAAINNVP